MVKPLRSLLVRVKYYASNVRDAMQAPVGPTDQGVDYGARVSVEFGMRRALMRIVPQILSRFKISSIYGARERTSVVFWATVCKTVRPMLSVRCLSVLSVCLSLTFVHCGQTLRRIKRKLSMLVGLGPGHIVLDGDPAPPTRRGTTPNFLPISVAAKWLHRPRCQATLC